MYRPRRTRSPRLASPLTFIALALLLALAPAAAQAAVLDVCASGCSYATVAGAIAAASPGDTLDLLDPVYIEGGLLVDKDLTIRGQGAALTAVQAGFGFGSAFDRVFHVDAANVSFEDLTIRYGNTFAQGGGVYADLDSIVSLTNVELRENVSLDGGGLFAVSGAIVTFRSSTVADNLAFNAGGGVAYDLFSTLTLFESTVSGNFAGQAGGGLAGPGSLLVDRSTLTGNYTDAFSGFGGGIAHFGDSALIVNSTISSNYAYDGSSGGGIAALGGDLTLLHSTLSGNVADLGFGGGIVNFGATVNAINSIIADSVGEDCFGPVLSPTGAPNLDTDGTCNFSLSAGNPDLAPLSDNGGATETHALGRDSDAREAAALDYCNDPAVTGADQRGIGRPQFGDCDLGAFEVEPCIFENAITATTGSITVGQFALVDSYSSCGCHYNPAFGGGANLSAGGGIEVHPDASVNGSANPGTPFNVGPKAVPAGLVSGGDLVVQSNQVVSLPAGDYLYDTVHLISNSTLVAEGGPVRIWVAEELRVDSNAALAPDDLAPPSLLLYTTDDATAVNFNSNAFVIGGVFAPNVPVYVGSNAEVYGSLVGESVRLQANGIVHLDVELCADQDCPEPPPPGDPTPQNVTNAVEATLFDVVMGPDAFIDGDVQAAGDIVNNGAFVSGAELPLTPSSLTAMPIPEGLVSSGDLFVGSNQTVVLPAGDYLFEDVFLSSNSLLRGQSGQVRVWFTGSLEIGSNASAIGAKGCANNLWFFGQCGPGTVLLNEHSSDFNLVGVVYAPDLPITVYSNDRTRGALVGSSFDIRSNARITYDFSLLDGCDGTGPGS